MSGPDMLRFFDCQLFALPFTHATEVRFASFLTGSAEVGQGEIVAVCHHGIGSLRAAKLLREAGFVGARSLRGGMAAWVDEVDPRMARY